MSIFSVLQCWLGTEPAPPILKGFLGDLWKTHLICVAHGKYVSETETETTVCLKKLDCND